MEQLLSLFFGGGLGLLRIAPDILQLDRELPKSEMFAILLLNRRGSATMSELAADLGVPLSTATGIAARLTKRQLVTRERDPDDRRIILVQLTPKGQQLAERLGSEISQLINRIQKTLTPQEITQLISIVQKVMRAFSADPLNEAAQEQVTSARKIPVID